MNHAENKKARRYLTACAAVVLCFMLTGTDASPEAGGQDAGAGIDERLGSVIPLDITFADEQGRSVTLRELVDRPTVISLVYYSCNHTCPLLLSGEADVFSRIALDPGRDFSAITISFDENDTPAAAAQKRNDYIRAAGRGFPGRSWTFLTGNGESIGKITQAAGFRFRKSPNGFAHPVGLIVLSPEGKVTRYLYGVKFLPMDLTLAITEASKGLAVPTVRRALLYCYSYDPEGRRYVFNILKITAIATLLFITAFIAWLVLSGKKGRPGRT